MDSLGITFTEVEQSYYSELYELLNVDNQGRISCDKAQQLFACSHLQPNVIQRVVELCGGVRLGKQFSAPHDAPD